MTVINKIIYKVMKKLFFSLAFMLIGSFAFANTEEIITNKKGDEEQKSKIVVFENKNEEALDCAKGGGVCLITIYTNGVPRSYERCCDDIVIVKRPAILTAQ